MRCIQFLVVSAAVILLGSPLYGQKIDKVLSVEESKRVDLIISQLDKYSSLFEGKVIDVHWVATRKNVLGAVEARPAQKRRTTVFAHLVMGQDRYFSRRDFPFVEPSCDEEICVYDGVRTSNYSLKNSSVFLWEINCELPAVIKDLQIYANLTPCACWQARGNVELKPSGFQRHLMSCDWEGVVDDGAFREVVLRTRVVLDEPRAGSEKVYRFREFEGQLVLSGTRSRIVSPQRVAGSSEEFNAVHDVEYLFEYGRYGKLVMPSRIHTTITAKSLNLDGSPFQNTEPVETKNVTWTVKSCASLTE